jgi:2-polyprenyl-3-methyl-5-hydroxy-6-metoxy-1,4-benzoquinol methylase
MPPSLDACRICGSRDVTARITRTWGNVTSTWTQCSVCGVEHVDPYPTAVELAEYYDDAYVTKSCPGSVSHAVRYAPDYALRVHEEYALGLADVGLHGAALAELSILDFGCAAGIFLDFILGQGHERGRVLGADISAQMVRSAVERGLPAVETSALADMPKDSFDLITLWDVIEHVPDPQETIRTLTGLLTDKGRILIQTPRMGLLSEKLGVTFEHYLPLEHVHLFRRETLVRLLADHGLGVDRAASFGANAPPDLVADPYKAAYDTLAKATDNGATQIVLFSRG